MGCAAFFKMLTPKEQPPPPLLGVGLKVPSLTLPTKEQPPQRTTPPPPPEHNPALPWSWFPGPQLWVGARKAKGRYMGGWRFQKEMHIFKKMHLTPTAALPATPPRYFAHFPAFQMIKVDMRPFQEAKATCFHWTRELILRAASSLQFLCNLWFGGFEAASHLPSSTQGSNPKPPIQTTSQGVPGSWLNIWRLEGTPFGCSLKGPLVGGQIQTRKPQNNSKRPPSGLGVPRHQTGRLSKFVLDTLDQQPSNYPEKLVLVPNMQLCIHIYIYT